MWVADSSCIYILGRSVGLHLSLDDFQKVSDAVPFLADLKPSGKYVMEDVHKVCDQDTIFLLSRCNTYNCNRSTSSKTVVLKSYTLPYCLHNLICKYLYRLVEHLLLSATF